MKIIKASVGFKTVVFYLLCSAIYSSPINIHKIPLRLSPEYVYFATLAFGTDGQKIEVLLDTGSQNIAVFCDLCV